MDATTASANVGTAGGEQYTWRWTLMVTTAITLTVYLAIRFKKFYDYYRFFRNLPSPEYSKFFGNMHLIPMDAEGQNTVLNQMMKDNPKFSVFWLTPIHPHVFVYHPETMKAIYNDPGTQKPRGPYQCLEFGTEWVGEGLTLLNGEAWTNVRKRVNNAFHASVLRNYMDIYNASADKLIKKIDKYAESGESFDIFPFITTCLLETMMKCLLGLEEDLEQVEGEHHPYAQAILGLSDIWLQRFWCALLWPTWVYKLTPMSKEFTKQSKYLHGVCEDILTKRKKKLAQTGPPEGRNMDLIDIFLCSKDDNGKKMTEDEVMSQLNTFLFAAHDTTATAMGLNIYNLAKYDEYQTKVQNEVDDILDGRDSDEMLWDDLSKLKIQSICAKENMRLYQPIPMMPRTSDREVVIDGVKMPPGTIFLMSISLLHNNPTVWDKPDQYKPERFLKEDHDKHAYIPFSSGPRTCIGSNFSNHMERVITSRFFRRYNVQIAPGYQGPIKRMAAVMKPENGVLVTVTKRDHSKSK